MKTKRRLTAVLIFLTLVSVFHLIDLTGQGQSIRSAIRSSLYVIGMLVGVATIVLLLVVATSVVAIHEHIQKNGTKFVVKIKEDDEDEPWRESLRPD